MATYTPIQSIVLTSTASSVTFNSIPQTYTDLILVSSCVTAAGVDILDLVFNSDTGTNYSSTQISGNGSAASSTRYSSTSAMLVGLTDSVANPNISHIMNYSNTTTYKNVINRGNAPTSGLVRAEVGVWRSTAAINSILIRSDSSNTISAGSTFDLYGIASGTPYANGGNIITTDGTYWYHAFLSSGTFTTVKTLSCDVLVVAGGGGSGGYGGGGGAGGLLGSANTTFAFSTSYAITVGAGGTAGASVTNGGQGNNSSVIGGAISLTATGGGYGGGQTTNRPGGNGGSGGGSVMGAAIGTGTSGQGNNGGIGYTDQSQYNFGGGGGGASAAGGNSSQSAGGHSGNGGDGSSAYSSWGAATSTGQNVSGTYYYAGGGVGDFYDYAGNTAGTAGKGGGGAINTAGTSNTGGGGGAKNTTVGLDGTAGGSGIIIVRYPV